MNKIVYFDYCAIVLTCILLFSTVTRRMTRGRRNRAFLGIIILILATSVSDVCAINLDRLGPGNALAKHVFHSLYLLTHMTTTPSYVAYLFTLTDIWHRMSEKRALSVLFCAPLACGVFLMLINPFTGVVYYLDESDAYTRGPLFLLLYIIALAYTVLGVVHLLLHRKQFARLPYCALMSVFPVSLIVAVIQFFFPHYILEMFANTACLTFVSMMNQRPENLLDADTGLAKITAYVNSVRNASISSKRMEIVMLNVANYMILHDMLGYSGTMSMLRTIADHLIRLNRELNIGGEIYYLGQGKFRVVIDSRHFDKTEKLAELLCDAFRPGFSLNQMTINIVAHVCIARFPEDIDDIDSLLAFGSDMNKLPYTGEIMYASNLYRKEFYDIQKDIDRIIEEALTEHKFEVYYQPIYSVAEKRFNSAEALLRLKTEKHGFISPELFIPAAEKSGAIHRIGSFVIDEVCKFISSQEYRDLGIDYIEVNLSVAQCMRNDLAKEVLDTLKRYDVRPNQINLEITETAASYSQLTMMNNLKILQDAGISFSLDDFGTGYSNMHRIASLPLHIVKLDKSFTNMERNPRLLIVLENTIRMIKDMNMKIVVEGIETEDMAKQFSDLKCEYIQGYFYSKPIPRDDFVRFIRQTRGA